MRHKSFHEYIFLVSANDVMEHFAFPGNIDFAADDQGFDVFIHRLWNKVYVESRTISHANETQAQQVQNLAQEHFPPKLLWNENAEFKFSVNNEGEDVNKKPRSRENIAQHSEGNATNKRQRNRRLESEALWSFYTVENPDFLVCRFPRRYIDQRLQSFSSVLRPEV